MGYKAFKVYAVGYEVFCISKFNKYLFKVYAVGYEVFKIYIVGYKVSSIFKFNKYLFKV